MIRSSDLHVLCSCVARGVVGRVAVWIQQPKLVRVYFRRVCATTMPAAKTSAAARAVKAVGSPASGGGRSAAGSSRGRGAQDEASDLIDALLTKKARVGSPRASHSAEASAGAAGPHAALESPLKPSKVAGSGATRHTPKKRKSAPEAGLALDSAKKYAPPVLRAPACVSVAPLCLPNARMVEPALAVDAKTVFVLSGAGEALRTWRTLSPFSSKPRQCRQRCAMRVNSAYGCSVLHAAGAGRLVCVVQSPLS